MSIGLGVASMGVSTSLDTNGKRGGNSPPQKRPLVPVPPKKQRADLRTAPSSGFTW